MRVEASGNQFTFPQQCVCCESEPDTCLTVSASKSSGQRVVRTKTNTWDFPYCSHCLNHIAAANTALTLAGIVIVLVVVIAWSLAGWSGTIFGSLGAVGALILYVKLISNANKTLRNSCVGLGKAVGFIGWDGTHQVFEIGSPKYAREFMIANKRKLINVSHEARELLVEEAYDKQANNVQSARRYRK
jgi:hypothetical protein